MRESLKALSVILDKQVQSQKQLFELSGEKRGAIIKGDTEQLNKIVQLELREITKMMSAEKERKPLMSVISSELNIPAGASLKEIIQAVSADERPGLQRLHKDLTAVSSQLREINAANKALLEAQVEYSEAMLNLSAFGDDPLDNMYNQDGTQIQRDVKTSGFLDWHA